MHKNFIQIGYMDTRLQKTMKPLTAEVFEQLTNSPKVRQTIASIEAEPDQEKKNLLKQQLPVVLYACQMTASGERPSAENRLGQPSGLCLHDWDHMPVAPAEFYMTQIAGREDQFGIVLVHITPRGEGLRLVTVLKAGEQIAECQARLAEAFGMQHYADAKIKDITRLSFLPSKEYILYENKRGLFEIPAETQCNVLSECAVGNTESGLTIEQVSAGEPLPEDTHREPAIVTTSTPSSTEQQSLKAEKSHDNVEMQNVAENFAYNGLKYSTIIEALLNRLATQGSPKVGERNNVLFMLTRELRHICEYNFQTVYMLESPYFRDLPDAEVRRTISSAIATNGRGITPVLRGVIDELKNQEMGTDLDANAQELPKLPKLSAVEEMIIAHYPKHLRAQVFLAMLPIWGVYGTHIRFDFMDGRENSLSFMTAVVGKSTSGKAFAAHLFEQMTVRIRQHDAQERRKADEYLSSYNKASDSSEKPDDPRPRVKIYGDDITTSQLLEYLDNLHHEHGIQFTEEVARLLKSKRTIYGDNDDLYCKAFDNAIGGKESKSKQTRNINIPIYLNTLFCGTPLAMSKFYNNPEGGLNNRVIFTFMPKVRVKGFTVYTTMTEAERTQFDEVCDRLNEAGKDGQKIRLPWLERKITQIKSKWDKEDDENPDEVWYDLGKRALITAMRVGVLQWYLRGCPTDEKELRAIGKVVAWVADTMRQNVYTFCGNEYEQINESNNLLQQRQNGYMSKNKKLFSLLADDFTTQDLIALRMQNGGNSNVAMVICRWTADGLIRKVGDGRFHKLTSVA